MYQRDYMDSNIENQLTGILSDLNKVEGIVSSLIADNNGNVICHNMSQRTDTSLFGPMAHVITNSSRRLLGSSNGGEIHRVLVESKGGKALFLHLENIYFVVLMELAANVGLVMVSAKRVAPEIVKITKNVVLEVPVEEETITSPEEEIPVISEESEMSAAEPESGVLDLSEETETSSAELENGVLDLSEETETSSAELENEALDLSEESESNSILEAGESDNATSEESESDNIVESEELNLESVDKIIETGDLKEAAAMVIGSEKLDEMLKSEELNSLDDIEAKEELAEILGTVTKDDDEFGEVEVQNKTDDIVSDVENDDLKSSLEIKEAEIKAEIDSVLAEIKENERKSQIEELQSRTDYDDISEGIEETVDQTGSELKVEEMEEDTPPEGALPVIKPPISFPKLPEDVQTPTGDKERSDLILDIYEAIFLAMSIGASKIMGVSPARGLIIKFLPVDDCKDLLDGVTVKNNSVVDFDKIRKNAENIPVGERENILLTDFGKMITIITENYGKVMGYGAFRGIIRTEFKTINSSYGEAMNELGIKDKIHPELIDLFK